MGVTAAAAVAIAVGLFALRAVEVYGLYLLLQCQGDSGEKKKHFQLITNVKTVHERPSNAYTAHEKSAPFSLWTG